jgi:hypothetical protein
MRRRDFIGVIYGGALALPFAAAAQQPEKVWRIGEVFPLTPEAGGRYAQALEQRLAELGRLALPLATLDEPLRAAAAELGVALPA